MLSMTGILAIIPSSPLKLLGDDVVVVPGRFWCCCSGLRRCNTPCNKYAVDKANCFDNLS